jgi:hypothetical protein
MARVLIYISAIKNKPIINICYSHFIDKVSNMMCGSVRLFYNLRWQIYKISHFLLIYYMIIIPINHKLIEQVCVMNGYGVQNLYRSAYMRAHINDNCMHAVYRRVLIYISAIKNKPIINFWCLHYIDKVSNIMCVRQRTSIS